MGKNLKKKYVMLSDFNIRANNRGTAALGYGAIAFLLYKGYIDDEYEIIKYQFYWNLFRKHPQNTNFNLDINGKKWKYKTMSVWKVEKWLYKLKVHFFDTPFRTTISNLKLVAALNGGDGLTDIYGKKWLYSRLPEMNLAMELNIPFIVMPQTIGPFLSRKNMYKVISVLKRADSVFVRDTNFVSELENNSIPYEIAKDLSFYMKPESFPILIHKPCVGINVSGLAYSNKFGNLAGQFNTYPKLLEELVRLFQSKRMNIYLIPHAYNKSQRTEINNDDMESTKDFYDKLKNKTNVYLIDNDLISPQIKYLISQMDFFIGTRMHANFAAIFTNTPVFGLAYSYKFKGAFEANGIYNRTIEINNMPESEIKTIITSIENAYKDDVEKNKILTSNN